MTDHTLSEPRQLQHPGGKNGMWRVTCSCGYTTGPCASQGKAYRAAHDHKTAFPMPCGCEVGQGHVCPPPWVDAEEWAAALAYRAGDGWHDEVRS